MDQGNQLGALIRRLRTERGWSQARLAEKLNEVSGRPTVTRVDVYRWETARRTPKWWMPHLATVLDVPQDVLEASSVGSSRVPGRWDGFDPDERARMARALAVPSRAGIEVVAPLARVLEAQRHTEDVIGAVAVLGPVLAQLAILEPLVNGARGPARKPLVDIAAQWAQFAGWLHAAVDKPEAARAWFDRAAEWATETDNANMVANALSFRGHLAWMSGHSGAVVGLSRAARRDHRVFVGQRAYDNLQEARGHAMDGDEAAALRHLEQGMALADEEHGQESPPWSYYHTPAFLTLQRGCVHRYLGAHSTRHAREAIDLLNTGLRDLGEFSRAEWTSDYRAELAMSYLNAGDPEQAALAIEAHKEIISESTSPRPVRQIRELQRALDGKHGTH